MPVPVFSQKEKIIEAIHDMQGRIERDNEHIYRDKVTGLRLQGVSTVSSIVPKDWLAAWGAKEAVKFLGHSDYNDKAIAEEMLARISEMDVDEYMKLLKEAKGASSRKGKKAMIDGTTGHLWLESFVNARLTGKDIPEMATDELERPLVQFLAWEIDNVKEWIASEALVCNLDKFYAGQLDAIAVLKSVNKKSQCELALIDFKFATNISEEYYLQTAGYQACFEKYGIIFDKRIIIRLPKTLERDEWNPKTYKYEKKTNNIETKVVPTKYERDREAFYAALIVKSWINSLELK